MVRKVYPQFLTTGSLLYYLYHSKAAAITQGNGSVDLDAISTTVDRLQKFHLNTHMFIAFIYLTFLAPNKKIVILLWESGVCMKIRKKLIPILLFAGLGLLCLWLGSLVTPQQIQDAVSQCGSWAAAAYIGLFTLLPAFFFPVAALALAGGLLFGLVWGSIYTFLGAILNCTLMFLLARYVGREKVEQLIQKKLSPLWQKRLQNLNSRGGFLLLVILRLIPAVPYNLINYAFGLTSMSYRTYIIGSAIGIIPGTLAFINIGDKALDVTSPDFWIAIGLLALLLVVTGFLGKKCFPQNTEME